MAGSFLVIGIVAIGLSIPGFQLLADVFMTSPLSALVAGILFGLPILGFGILMPARTISGTRMLEKILGFQEFLDRVESDRYRKMITSPEVFEAYLPYAMALGVSAKWAKKFEGIYEQESPGWYVGHHPTRGFSTSSFEKSLTSSMNSTAQGMVASPRSSGAGGGGFSGGGGGGGGGGSW